MNCIIVLITVAIILLQAICLIECNIEYQPASEVHHTGPIINRETSPDDDAINLQTEPIDTIEQAPVRKCVPMLDLVGSGSSRTNSSPFGAKANYSFDIGDIDLPIAQADGSVNSAMKLLSTFSSQFDVNSPEDSAVEPMDNVIRFRESHLLISGLNLSMLNIHLYTNSDSKFGVGITIKNTTMTGKFSYNGPLMALTEPKLAAYYRMSIDNIYMVASSNLTKQARNSEHESEHRFNMKTNDFRLNITNLGYINIEILDQKDSRRPTTNYLMRMLQRFLQKTIKRTYYTFESTIREALEREGRRILDCELTRFSPLLDKQSPSLVNSSQRKQSDLVHVISGEIARAQLSTVQLPNFDYQQSILGSTALVQFYNGSISGLHNIQLNGETWIKLQNEHLFVNTSIGWQEIKPYYNWELYFGSAASNISRSSSPTSPPTSKGHVAFTIKAIDFDAVITKGLSPHTNIIVDQLTIKKLESPKMDISGLPGMNRLTRGAVNFFMGRLKQRLATSIQPALKQQLEKSLNKMSLLSLLSSP